MYFIARTSGLILLIIFLFVKTKVTHTNISNQFIVHPSSSINTMNTLAFKTVHSILSPVDASKLSGRYETTATDKFGKYHVASCESNYYLLICLS